MELFIWMKKNKITARKMAKDLGISEATLSNISNNKTAPSLLLAMQIAKFTKGALKWEDLLNSEGKNKWEKYLHQRENKIKK